MVPIGMPTTWWQIIPNKSTNKLSMRNSNILITCSSMYHVLFSALFLIQFAEIYSQNNWFKLCRTIFVKKCIVKNKSAMKRPHWNHKNVWNLVKNCFVETFKYVVRETLKSLNHLMTVPISIPGIIRLTEEVFLWATTNRSAIKFLKAPLNQMKVLPK